MPDVPPEIENLRGLYLIAQNGRRTVLLSDAEAAVLACEKRMGSELLECDETLRTIQADYAAFREQMLAPLKAQEGRSVESLSWDELLAVAVRNLNAALDERQRTVAEIVEALRLARGDEWMRGRDAANLIELWFTAKEGESA